MRSLIMEEITKFELVEDISEIEWEKSNKEKIINAILDWVREKVGKAIKCADKNNSRILNLSQEIPMAFIKYDNWKYHIEWESNILKKNWWLEPIFKIINTSEIIGALEIAKNMPINTENGWIYRSTIHIKINESLTVSPSIWYDENEKIYSIFFIQVKIKDNIINYINWLVSMSSEKDPETWEHQNRLSLISSFLANKVKEKDLESHIISKKKVEYIWATAPAHDIWKVWISDDILGKMWKLLPEEFEKIKTHSHKWAKQISRITKIFWEYEIIDTARNIALSHHEKWNWTWYPEWLKWYEIPIEARIVAIVDVFDALKSKRPYKEAFSDEKTKKILLEWRWKHFDPIILDIFLEYYDEICEIRKENEDKH